MRVLRNISFMLFIAAAALFGLYHFYLQRGGDKTPPVITMDTESIAVSVAATEEELLAGVTAADQQDGDVTASLFVEQMDNFSTDGTREFTVVAYDKAGNIAKAKRELTYTDYGHSRFTMSAPLRFLIGTTDILSTIGAQDCLDGDISSHVKTTGKYTLSSAAGEYPMEFSVANSAGDVAYLTATVTLYDNSTGNTAPSITLSDYIVYTHVGEKLTPWDYVESISLSRRLYQREGKNLVTDSSVLENNIYPTSITRMDVKITDGVDYETPGCYEVLYKFTFNDQTGSVRLIVVVE